MKIEKISKEELEAMGIPFQVKAIKIENPPEHILKLFSLLTAVESSRVQLNKIDTAEVFCNSTKLISEEDFVKVLSIVEEINRNDDNCNVLIVNFSDKRSFFFSINQDLLELLREIKITLSSVMLFRLIDREKKETTTTRKRRIL